MRLPLLDSCDVLIAGSGMSAMAWALALSGSRRVLLVTEDTCLYAELDRACDWRLPANLPEELRTQLFPDGLRRKNGLFHPDGLKRHGERLMAQRGVSLLYACQVLGRVRDYVVIAHKSGLYAIRCVEAMDARAGEPLSQPCYCLQTMRGQELQVLRLPMTEEGNLPQTLFRRYEAALACLPRGNTLARGGYALTEAEGLRFSSAPVQALADVPLGTQEPLRHNPLFDQREQAVDIPGLAAPEEAYDVVVAGGGTAGASSALFCARQGLKTLLLEMNHQLGGTATAGGVSTYWFGLREGATRQIDQAVAAYCRRLGLPRKACLWSEDDTFPPDLKAHALLGLCLDAGVDIHLGSLVCGVRREGQRVAGVYETQAGTLRYHAAKIILDCTGDGDVCMFAGAAHTYGSDRDGMTYWASLAQYTAPDQYRNNFSTMVHVGDPLDYTRFIQAGRLRGENMYDHGRYVAVRESRHIRGMAQVTLDGILSMETAEQPLYTCFSNYDPKGRLTDDRAYFGLLCPNQRIPVPRGSVIPVDASNRPLEGLLVGGKAISCTHDAFPGIRMQPDLQRQGLALAALAGRCITQGVPAWEAQGVDEAIIALGGDTTRPGYEAVPSLEETIASLRGDEPWEWLDAPPDACTTRVEPVVQVMTAPSEQALPLLRKAWEQAAAPGLRLLLARLLLWHGDERGAGEVIRAAEAMLDAAEGLPRRVGSVNYGQLLPDHGLMPEIVYLLNSLSHTASVDVLPVLSRMVARLETSARNWHDLRAGIYCYCECPAYAAMGRKDRALIPLIQRVLALPELNSPAEDGLMQERFDMLRITLLGTLHTLGDEAGRTGLETYLRDARRPFAQAAAMMLKQ